MEPRNIFVFGSNTQGCHGKGAALEAVQEHGAINGCPIGLVGSSYAIITKELRQGWTPIGLEFIDKQVAVFKMFAARTPYFRFNVTAIGCGLAGFRPVEIAPMFVGCTPNVVLPDVFLEYVR